jgi:hypothetical protein
MEWLRLVQHDLNCLADANRATRLRALQRLEAFFSQAAPGEGAAAAPVALAHAAVRAPLVQLLGDAAEGVRSQAVSLLQTLAERADDSAVSHLLEPLAAAAKTRMAGEASQEPSEELRQQQIELVRAVLARARPEAVQAGWESVVAVASKGALDAFPEAKTAAAELACVLAARSSVLAQDARDVALASLCRHHLANLKHQRSGVRTAALAALSAALVAAGSLAPKWCVETLQALAALAHDRAPVVRQGLAREAGAWFRSLDGDRAQRAALLLVVLSALSDESAEVVTEARLALDGIAHCVDSAARAAPRDPRLVERFRLPHDNVWPPASADPEMDALPAEAPSSPDVLAPLPARATPALRFAVRALLKELVTQTLHDMVEWTVRTRIRATGVLHVLVLLSERAATAHLPQMVSTLARLVQDDEAEVVAAVGRCTRAVGWVTGAAAFLPVIWQSLAGGDARATASVLLVLDRLLSGAAASGVLRFGDELLAHMQDADLAGHPEDAVRVDVLKVLATTLARWSDALAACGASDGKQLLPADAQHRLLRTVLVADATSEARSECETAAALVLKKLASFFGWPSEAELLAAEFARTLAELLAQAGVPPPEQWRTETPQRTFFCKLVRRCPAAAAAPGSAATLETIVRVVAANAHPDREPLVRADALALLHSLAKARVSLAAHAAALVRDVLAANCVWRAGKPNAVLRLQATVLIEELLAGDAPQHISSEAAGALLQHLLPLLRTNMDDEDPELRMAVLRLLATLIARQPAESKLPEISVTDVHRDVLKRVDDASDEIRVMALRVLRVFLDRFAPSFEAYDPTHTHFGYIVQTLLVHIDDASEAVRAAVYEFLRSFARHDRVELVRQARVARERHASPLYTDRLIAEFA